MKQVSLGVAASLTAIVLVGVFGFLFGWAVGDVGHQVEVGWRCAAMAEAMFGWAVGLLAFGVASGAVRP